MLCGFVACVMGVARAYRVGDAIDVDVLVGSEKHDVLRSQTPLFAMDSSCEFLVQSGSFSMTFEDGLWGLPSIPMLARQGVITSWVITFVYSKSGDGEIHTVTYDAPVYATRIQNDGERQTFTVSYRWIKEPELNTNAGQTAMVLIVVLASVYMISSRIDDDGFEGTTRSSGNLGTVPKHE